MSLWMLERRFARSRAVEREERRRVRSRLWAASLSRRRERLFCFRAEEVRVVSESRRRVSLATTPSRLVQGISAVVLVGRKLES